MRGIRNLPPSATAASPSPGLHVHRMWTQHNDRRRWKPDLEVVMISQRDDGAVCCVHDAEGITTTMM
eukprot:27564-Eustigmatos_ZCMA.PRE.1